MTNTKRSFLYSLDAPSGRIFEGADAISAALKDGWVDCPTKVKRKKGGAKGATNDSK